MISPFHKSIDKLDEADLRRDLQDFVESWVVEYKGPLKWGQNSDIAKSIASFANTYGGWLFLGIEADQDNRPKLEALDGVPWKEGMSETIYQIAGAHLSPAPYLLCHPIKVGDDRAVVAVHVMESASPPHIHVRTGTIPVRKGNTTESVRLEDRAELNALYAKADLNRQHVQKLLDRHERGIRLANYVQKQSHELYGPIKEKAYWVCLVYATTRLGGLLPYAVSRDFPSCDWPGRRDSLLAGTLDSSQTPRQFSAEGAYVLAYKGRGFYVNTFGHFAVSGLTADINGIRDSLEDRLEKFLNAGAALYREAGYWGEVTLEYAFGPSGAELGRVVRSASVLPLDDVDRAGKADEVARINVDRAGMADEVERILGLWDRKKPGDE